MSSSSEGSSPEQPLPPSPIKPCIVYSRNSLLDLSRSELIFPPDGLKSLKEWYGEYEIPAHANPSLTPNSRTPDRRRLPRNESEDGSNTNNGNNSYGSMGDFKLPTSTTNSRRNRSLLSSADALNATLPDSKRRESSRERRPEEKGSYTRPSAQPLGTKEGSYRSRDGRSEEPGWRTKASSSNTASSRPIPLSAASERKPAWMDDEDGVLARSPPAWMNAKEKASAPISPTLQPRSIDANGIAARPAPPSNVLKDSRDSVDEIQAFKAEQKALDAARAWKAEQLALDAAKKAKSSAAVSLSAVSGTSAQSKPTEHVDEIQKFKAEMRELERKRKEAAGILQPEAKVDFPTQKIPDITSQAKPISNLTSMYDDLRLVNSSNKPSVPQSLAPEPTARSASRFAKYFKPETGSQAPAASPPVPPLPTQQAVTLQPSAPNDANGLMAALLGPQSQQSQAYSTRMPAQSGTPADQDSMQRVLQMLQMSSQPSLNTAPPSKLPSQPPSRSSQSSGPSDAFSRAPPFHVQQQQQSNRLPRSSNGSMDMTAHSMPGLVSGLPSQTQPQQRFYPPSTSGQPLPYSSQPPPMMPNYFSPPPPNANGMNGPPPGMMRPPPNSAYSQGFPPPQAHHVSPLQQPQVGTRSGGQPDLMGLLQGYSSGTLLR